MPFLFLAVVPLAAQLVAAPAGNTSRAAVADTVGQSADSVSAARVTIMFGTGAQVSPARDLDFTIAGAPGVRHRGGSGASAQVRFLREPDALTTELARRATTGERYAQADVIVEHTGSTMVIHLHDVQVLSTRLQVNGDDASLTQQRLTIEESIAQLSAQRAEARRQLGAIEALAREKLSPVLELARARSDADVVDKRLAAQYHRLALVNQQIATWSPVQEAIVLSASRAEIETR